MEKAPKVRASILQVKVLRWLLLGLWTTTAAITTTLDLEITQWLDYQTHRFFFQIRGPVSPPKNIILLLIDDDSLGAAKTHQNNPDGAKIVELLPVYPFPRKAYGEVITRLMSAGAKTVVLDTLFDLPSSDGEEDDRTLQKVLDRYSSQVVLATAYTDSFSEEGLSTQLLELTPALKTEPQLLGFANFLLEIDGRVHRLGSAYRERLIVPLFNLPSLPSLAEATLKSAQIPYPQPKGERIFFYGSSFATFPRIPFWRVLEDRELKRLVKAGTFKDKIVLIGTSASAPADFQRTPVAEKMPGVEIHANAVATLQEGKAIAELFPNYTFRGLFVLILTGIVGIILKCWNPHPWLQLGVSLGIGLVWFGSSYFIFTYTQWIIPTIIPILAMSLCGFSDFGIGTIRDRLEKARLRFTLERYVAEPVVNEILKQPDDFYTMLQGRKIKVAVLFSDVRGFTTLSYKLPPETLISQLNTYFHGMVEAIIEAGGTLDKFIGDAVMAEFGFPISQGAKNDGMNAIKAALAMRQELARLRAVWQRENKVPFYNGIGISYGEAIAGDIGSWRRKEYGVIGDTVNVASRVEGMTKQLETDIVITESLYQLVRDEIEVIDFGEYLLKGREESCVRLYGVIGLKGDNPLKYNNFVTDLKKYLHP